MGRAGPCSGRRRKAARDGRGVGPGRGGDLGEVPPPRRITQSCPGINGKSAEALLHDPSMLARSASATCVASSRSARERRWEHVERRNRNDNGKRKGKKASDEGEQAPANPGRVRRCVGSVESSFCRGVMTTTRMRIAEQKMAASRLLLSLLSAQQRACAPRQPAAPCLLSRRARRFRSSAATTPPLARHSAAKRALLKAKNAISLWLILGPPQLPHSPPPKQNSAAAESDRRSRQGAARSSVASAAALVPYFPRPIVPALRERLLRHIRQRLVRFGHGQQPPPLLAQPVPGQQPKAAGAQRGGERQPAQHDQRDAPAAEEGGGGRRRGRGGAPDCAGGAVGGAQRVG
eukprot:scaffold9850_cov93-Isochrysis_galbana.AAC.4